MEESTLAVFEHDAAALIYLARPGDPIRDTTLHLWVHEVVAAVREAITNR